MPWGNKKRGGCVCGGGTAGVEKERRVCLERVDERVCQQGTLWQHGGGGDQAGMTLHHILNRASGNEAVVFLSQAILLPSIYRSESLAHQRGIYSPSVWLSQSGGKCNLTPLCLHVSGGQRSAAWEKQPQ